PLLQASRSVRLSVRQSLTLTHEQPRRTPTTRATRLAAPTLRMRLGRSIRRCLLAAPNPMSAATRTTTTPPAIRGSSHHSARTAFIIAWWYPQFDSLLNSRGGAAAAASLGVNLVAGGVKNVTSSTGYLVDKTADQIVKKVVNYYNRQGWSS